MAEQAFRATVCTAAGPRCRLTLPSGGTVMSVRPLILSMYILFSGAGVASLMFPSRAVSSNVNPAFTYVWAAFFLVGGLTCLAGVLTHSWWGEMIGLPLIASSSLLYGTAVLIQYSDPSRRDGAYLFVGSLLVAQSISLAERWVTRMRLVRMAQRISREATE